jgi:tetratricopeptide (TPR) repeat protein
LAIGTADVLEDRLESALENAEAGLSLLRREKHRALPGAYAAAYMLGARVHRILGTARRALGAAMRAAHLARRARRAATRSGGDGAVGGDVARCGPPEEAEARLREALLVAEEIEDRRGQALARLFLGILYVGGVEGGGATDARACGGARVVDGLEPARGGELCASARGIHREAGEVEKALELVTRAQALVKKFGAELNDRVVIEGTYALVVRTMGQDEEAQEVEGKLRERRGAR